MPAHGMSTINKDFKGTEHTVENIIYVIRKIVINENFSLLGMSYGAYVAQGVMDRMIGKVEGIALIAPAVHNRTGRLPHKVVLEREEDIANDIEKDIKEAFETHMVTQTNSMLKRFITEIQPGRELADREFLISNWRENHYFLKEEPFAHHERIDVPSLFLMGKQDGICGWQDQYEVFKKFSRASFVVLDGTGHMLHMEKREMASACVKEWLTEMENSRKSEAVRLDNL
ncbi:MAG: alpha/beta fold hydrolase [Bacillota bacterium]